MWGSRVQGDPGDSRKDQSGHSKCTSVHVWGCGPAWEASRAPREHISRPVLAPGHWPPVVWMAPHCHRTGHAATSGPDGPMASCENRPGDMLARRSRGLQCRTAARNKHRCTFCGSRLVYSWNLVDPTGTPHLLR